MISSVKLTAEAEFGHSGQFIGLVTGPDRKFGTALEFVGTKYGKRGELTTFTIVDPGLYKVRNVTRKGNDNTYYIIWSLDGDLIKTEITEGDAFALAKDLTIAKLNAKGRSEEIADTEHSITESLSRDQEGIVEVKPSTAAELGIPAGRTRRADVVAARRRYIDRLRGVTTPERPIDLDGGPSDPAARRRLLTEERARAVARLEELHAEDLKLTARIVEIDMELHTPNAA